MSDPKCPHGRWSMTYCIDCYKDRIAALELQLAEAQAKLATMLEEHAVWEKHGLSQIVTERDGLKAKLEQARETLRGIANNTCCASCQEAALVASAALEAGQPKRPIRVCLCGSTRFTDIMLVKQWELTKQGKIVLAWCALPESYFIGPHIGDAEGVKDIVDEVHKRKIDLSDEVMILNVGGYIGESTRSEWEYALKTGKPIVWLEPDKALAALEAGEEATNQVILPDGCLPPDSPGGPPGVEFKVEKEVGR